MTALALMATIPACSNPSASREAGSAVTLPDPRKVRQAVTHGGAGQALADAVFEGDRGAVQRMLASDPSLRDTHVPPVSYPDFAPEGQYGDLLTFAVAQGDAAMLRTLLDAGVPADGAVPGKALDLAIDTHRLALAEILLKAGAKPDPATKDAVDIPLLSAARRGDVEGARLLLMHGADPDWRDGSGTTLLQTVVDMDAMRVAEVMIDAGADAWALSSGGAIPARGIHEPLQLTSEEEEQARQRLLLRVRRSDRPWPPPSAAEMRTARY